MKCVKCKNDFPSDYYFEINGICKNCFKNLSENAKLEAYKSNKASSSKEQATTQEIHGNKLICPICKHDQFWNRKTLMNTPAATFFGVEWANKEAQNYICNRCGYVFWFFREK